MEGFYTYPPERKNLRLGPCCICEQRGEHVRTEIFLQQQSPQPSGWSCNFCYGQNPSVYGAMAVLCDNCFEAYKRNEIQLKFMKNGTRGRILYESVPYIAFHQEHEKKYEEYLDSDDFKKHREELARSIQRCEKLKANKAAKQAKMDAELEAWANKVILGR